MEPNKTRTIHEQVGRMLTSCLVACLILTITAMSIIVNVCNEQLARKNQDVNRCLMHIIESAMTSVEKLSYDVLKNERIQENLLITDRCDDFSSIILNVSELNQDITGMSLESPNYVKMLTVIDNKRNIYNYGSILMVSSLQQELFEKMDIDHMDGRCSWYYMDGSKPRLMLCRTIRQARNVTLKPIGFIVLVVDIHEMLSHGNILHDSYTENTLVYLHGQPIYHGGNVTKTVLRDIQLPEDHYSIQKLDGKRYFITASNENKSGLRFINVSSYDKLFLTLRITQVSVLLIALVIFGAIMLATHSLSNRIFARLNELTAIVRNTQDDDFLARFDKELITDKDEVGILAMRFYELLGKIDHLVNRNLRKQLSMTQATVKMLQAQIHPHFLYNTLDSISALAEIEGNKRIASMTSSLACFMRASFQWQAHVTLSQEIELIQEYLRIYRIRYGKRIDALIDWHAEDSDRLMPKMILQPIVENAIKYGLECKVGICRIRLRIRCRRGLLSLSVWDNGRGFPAEQADAFEHPEFFGDDKIHGMYNVARRLYYTYGDRLKIRIRSSEGRWTNVSILFPAGIPYKGGVSE